MNEVFIWLGIGFLFILVGPPLCIFLKLKLDEMESDNYEIQEKNNELEKTETEYTAKHE